jgi:hypothetical protein
MPEATFEQLIPGVVFGIDYRLWTGKAFRVIQKDSEPNPLMFSLLVEDGSGMPPMWMSENAFRNVYDPHLRILPADSYSERPAAIRSRKRKEKE